MIIQRKSYIFVGFTTFFGFSLYCYSVALKKQMFTWDNMLRKRPFMANGMFLNGQPIIEPEDYLINTPGCYIPNYARNFKYNYTRNKVVTNSNACGARAIFVDRVANRKIRLRVDKKKMKKYSVDGKYTCCYKFAIKSVTYVGPNNYTRLSFTKCMSFQPGAVVQLDHEIVAVSCNSVKNKKEIYFDAYIKLKKLRSTRRSDNEKPWNVIIIGLDSMSRKRLIDTMPKTYKLLQKRKWMEFRGYQRVEYKTFPDILAVMTGKNATALNDKCNSSIHRCAEYFIWDKYMKSGYVTAYGEDGLASTDTFSIFDRFGDLPTNHYMRPFYRLGESRRWNILCTRKSPSAIHMLNYAKEFIDSYKKELFFGMFWINSYSRSDTDNPSMLDKELANWLTKLNSTGILRHTFIILLSNHGIQHGEMRLPVESYYDERLPMLFIWVPYEFRDEHSMKYSHMRLNQHRMVTPYDIYITLGDILSHANRFDMDIRADGCLRCRSLFDLHSLHRSCPDVHVGEKWCSCRTIKTVERNAQETDDSVQLVVEQINNKTKNIKTIPCMTCNPLTLLNILRSHMYQNNDIIYHIVAFELSHHVSFEATVGYRANSVKVLSVKSITDYNKKGNCVLNPNDRPFCNCNVTTDCMYDKF